MKDFDLRKPDVNKHMRFIRVLSPPPPPPHPCFISSSVFYPRSVFSSPIRVLSPDPCFIPHPCFIPLSVFYPLIRIWRIRAIRIRIRVLLQPARYQTTNRSNRYQSGFKIYSIIRSICYYLLSTNIFKMKIFTFFKCFS